MKPAMLTLALLSVAASAPAIAATDLFFSEYVEGSSYNKALEIYNGTGADVDLAAYQIRFYYNGNTTAGKTIDLSGTLAAGDVVVVADEKAGDALQAAADLLGETGWFNGNDAVELSHSGAAIDAIGEIGGDPDVYWGRDTTLRRKTSVTDGDADGSDPFDPSLEWDGYAKDSFDDLGRYGTTGGGTVSHCGEAAESIHAIQGTTDISPMKGATVSVEAVVTADMRANLGGFFLQEEDDQADADSRTSEGVFVYGGGSAALVVGDLVRVSGRVSEYYGLTELSNVTGVEVCDSGLRVTPATVTLPFTGADAAEAFEGMSVVFPQALTVSENYDLGRYGELILANGRLYQPTHSAAPGVEAQAVAEANALNQVTLDDGSNQQNPDPIVFPAPKLSASNTLRTGDTVAGLTGVMSYGYSAYRIYPTATPVFVASNPRPADLDLPADNQVRVASFNVLNYFNSIDNGEFICGPSGDMQCRGADSNEEFQRQQAKIVDAITGLHADVVGLMEIENNGYGADGAIANLVDALNQSDPDDVQYAYVDPVRSALGTDVISVGLIYNVTKVKVVGTPAVLDNTVDPRFIDTRNRPTLAVSFQDLQSNQRFTVAVNHLKSKGSACDDIGDPDTGDGQGNCNLTRTQAAAALVDWLAGAPTGIKDPDTIIIGDLNAYAKEDPIATIKAGGYHNLVEEMLGDAAYSYVYFGQSGYLDHALASEEAAEQVDAVREWHINADEPSVLDYNEEYKSVDQVGSLYADDPYRASDHDPVVIDVKLVARCDLNMDGEVDWNDRIAFQRAFLSREGDRRYLRRADMNRDGSVNARDQVQFSICTQRQRVRGLEWFH